MGKRDSRRAGNEAHQPRFPSAYYTPCRRTWPFSVLEILALLFPLCKQQRDASSRKKNDRQLDYELSEYHLRMKCDGG